MRRRASILTLAVLGLAAACAPQQREPAPVVYQGTVPSGSAQASQPAPEPSPAPLASEGVEDARGVVLYEGYETIRARRGDSVESMARRVGISGYCQIWWRRCSAACQLSKYYGQVAVNK